MLLVLYISNIYYIYNIYIILSHMINIGFFFLFLKCLYIVINESLKYGN